MIVGSCVPRFPLNATICGGSLELWTPTSQRSPPEELLLDDEELEEELELLEDELELLLEDEDEDELDDVPPPQLPGCGALPLTVMESIFARPFAVVACRRMLLVPAFRFT